MKHQFISKSKTAQLGLIIASVLFYSASSFACHVDPCFKPGIKGKPRVSQSVETSIYLAAWNKRPQKRTPTAVAAVRG